MFRNRLQKVFRHRRKQARKAGLGCYRIYDHDLPEFPLSVDLYEQYLYVAEYERKHGMDEEAHARWWRACVDVLCEVLEVSSENLYVKLRKRKAGRQGQYQKLDQEGAEKKVQENGLTFLVNLTDYLDTGLFLDHRLTRQWVRQEAAGRRVLNLFAYTGSFSVYAAAGGASAVKTVDLSNTYLTWARRNMEANGFVDESRYSYAQADVLQFLKEQEPDSTDLIILDPPTFSNSKRMEDFMDVQRDHVSMIQDAGRALSAEGQLIFSTNYRRFELDRASLADWNIRDITRSTTPFDFEGRFSRLCYLLTRQ